jgi:hypothetical protein
MLHTWTAPALDTAFIRYDENGTPVGVCRYVDFLAELESEFWPKSEEDFDLLLWSYNAEIVE